ncbi:flavin reductase family protein [Paenibacillus rhizovicinus]|uniref:Flavin reductase family protein n=1 Tax=Paenibacillus rhizovicinus TaxID=2704463 RepID=A0A6C0PBH6_9BACL|nr:flavin reductase family protein [Paenibacillus rhizovicinus]QHW35033.1 flavin reductase family protein [Paenibacillus rhizovicinus]
MHVEIEPKILYFGSSIVLISTMNVDGTPNLAPMSSAWWLNRSCMLGLSSKSQTALNIMREGECVLNLPSIDLISAIESLTLITGRDPVPESKKARGYQFEPNKFGKSKLTPLPSRDVKAPRVQECPVHLEAKLIKVHPFEEPSSLIALEVHIEKIHVDQELTMKDHPNYIDPSKWNPMIMNFCEYFGLSEQLSRSRLSAVFGPDVTQ